MATPVSQDAGDGSDDLRRIFRCARCGADRWVGWRAGPEREGWPRKAQCVPCGHVQELPPLPPTTLSLEAAANLGTDVDRVVAEFAALPECTACGGTGKDDHGTVFEEPLAVHFAGPPCEIVGRRRQLCMWCGHVLRDSPRAGENAMQPWPVGALVRIEDGIGTLAPHEPGDELPPGCCALPDDEPVCPCDPETQRCSKCANEPSQAQETRAAADWPAEPVDTHADEQEADRA